MACGLGAWGTIDRSGAVVHAAEWGEADGDGSEQSPVTSLTRAVELAADGAADLIAVDVGTYVESLSFTRYVGTLRIEGRCADGVIVQGSDTGQPTIAVLGGTVELMGLSVSGGRPGIFAGEIEGGLATSLVLERVVITDATTGLAASGAQTRLDVRFSDLRSNEEAGMRIEAGARLTAEAVVVERNRRSGLVVTGADSNAELADCEVRATELDDVGTGTGVAVLADASFVGTRLVVADGEGPGVVVAGGSFDCTDCSVQANALAGVAALDSASVRLTGGAVMGSVPTSDQPHSGVGLFAHGAVGLVDMSATDVDLAGHAGPAVYLRGPGRYVIDGCRLDDSGTGEGVAALLAALDGVPRWQDELGLLVRGSQFTHVPLDGALLHASSAFFDSSTFETGSGFDIWSQECAGIPSPIDSTGQAIDNGCQGAPREVDPRVEVIAP